MNVQSTRRAMGAIVGGDFSDPTNERLIYLSAAGLLLVGVLLLLGTAMWWRRGRQEHPALSPLEVMGQRSWAKAADGDRRRRLDSVRISGAGAASNDQVLVEPVDLQALVRSVPQAFDDLREPGEVVEQGVAAEPDDSAVAVAVEPDGDAAVEVDGQTTADSDGDAEAADIAEPPVDKGDPDGEVLAAAHDAVVEADVDATSLSAERPVDDVGEGLSGDRSKTVGADTKVDESIDPML